MQLITLNEAKIYLRVDILEDDDLISSLLESSAQLVSDVARLTREEQTAVFETESAEGDDPDLTSRRALMKTATLYVLAYSYEHRESADYHEMVMTLRAMLHAIREGRDFG